MPPIEFPPALRGVKEWYTIEDDKSRNGIILWCNRGPEGFAFPRGGDASAALNFLVQHRKSHITAGPVALK